VPFCVTKCPYCDFFSVAGPGHDRRGTLEALLHEAARRAPRRPRTVFLGGGTPSFLTEPELVSLLDGLDRLTGFRDAALEVTAECNPESLDGPRARLLLDLGVTRLSIGFQSLREETLRLFGRAHTAEQGFRAYEAARAAGCRSVSVDLIYAAPGQTPEAWRADLARVLELRPDHLSAYNLTFEEGTAFEAWMRAGRLRPLPEEVELELFQATRELAAAAGLEHYEISNYASTGKQCLHNVNYWRNGEYVGLGPSAVSRVGRRRAGNVRALTGYVEGIAGAGSAEAWSETLDPVRRLGETWWLGLRLGAGVDPREALETAGMTGADDPALPIARGLVAAGLLQCSGKRYRLTERGLPLADHVAARFIVPADES
jgi:putative oxygen-independent coproporphyrinogen III oxidase